MSRVIISTVGTSLLGNLKNRNPNGISDPTEYIKANPQAASAEANALSRLATEGDELVFLHSDTDDGAYCSEALCSAFDSFGHSTVSRRIAGMSYNEKGFVSHGLRQLVRLLADAVRTARRQNKEALFNATGGFKAEIAYSTVLGLLLGVPVCYIHEKFGDIVEMPASPVSWDYELFTWNVEFFEWIDAEPRSTPEVQQRLSAMPEMATMLLEDSDDGYTYLSPLGEAYLEAFRYSQYSRQPLKIAAEALDDLNSMDYTTQGHFRHLLARIRDGQAGDWQRSAETLSGGVSKFPKGHTPYRLFFVERESVLHVLELSGHTEERRYQRLMQSIRWSQYEHAEFIELP